MNHKEENIFSIGLFILGLAIILWVITLPGCKTNMPAIDVSFWAGDSAKDGVSRAQENKTLSCQDPEFDNYVCLTYSDVKKIMNAMLSCKQWSAETLATDRDVRHFVENNPELIRHVLPKKRHKELEPIRY